MWGDQWVCDCDWSNITLRRKCRNCGTERRDDHRHEGHGEVLENLEAAIAAKSAEIAATGLCQWATRNADEIDALPADVRN